MLAMFYTKEICSHVNDLNVYPLHFTAADHLSEEIQNNVIIMHSKKAVDQVDFSINVYVKTQGATEHCLELRKCTYNEDTIIVIRSVWLLLLVRIIFICISITDDYCEGLTTQPISKSVNIYYFRYMDSKTKNAYRTLARKISQC
jgi:dolichol kinase